jgi:hypothetical protein
MPAVVHDCSYEAQIDWLELCKVLQNNTQIEIFPDLSVIRHYPNLRTEKMPPNSDQLIPKNTLGVDVTL